MSKIISLILAICTISNICFADCDFTKIVDNPDGTKTYSKELHICVGQLVQDNKVKDEQIKDLNKAIDLKTLAIDKADQRTQLWMDTSFKLEDNIQKIDSLKNTNAWIYFGLGALTIIGAAYAAKQLR